MNHGGARAGSGRKRGFKFDSTMKKEAVREKVRQMITDRMSELIDAQMDNAAGIKHLMMRDPATGKFERLKVESDDPKVQEAQIDAALSTGNACWIYTKDPSVQAFTDLLNRALDKPAEQVKVTGADSGPVVFKWQE